MPKKKIRLRVNLPFYRKDWKGEVPWEDVHVTFSMKRKKVKWFPMIQGRVGLRDQLESAIRYAEESQKHLDTGVHPRDSDPPMKIHVEQADGTYKETTLEEMIFKGEKHEREPADPKYVKELQQDARDLYSIYAKKSPTLISDGDGWDDWIYVPKETLGRKDMEQAVSFGLKEKFGITEKLRFIWAKTDFFISPSSGGWDTEVEFPEWVKA